MNIIYSSKTLALSLFLLITSALSAQRVTGKVIDIDTGEELPFVSIVYNKTLSLGTTTDLSGTFSIPDKRQIVRLSISCIGYQSQNISKADIPYTGEFVVKLKSLNTQLEEAVVTPGENPALELVRKAIKNSELNDPRKFKSYTYKAYSKNILTRNIDSLVTASKQLQLMSSDTLTPSVDKYLLMSEAVSHVNFLEPDHYKEEIIGTKISGFKNAIYAVGSDNIQHFGLYEDVVQVLTEYYLTPLAKTADKKYFYVLQDTIVKGTDSTFIMYFQPKIGSNFEGLKGEIHINSNQWALEYVFAEPNYKGTVDFAIEQEYQLLESGDWFPKTLGMLLQMERLPLFKDPGFLHSMVYVDSVNLEPGLVLKDFDHVKRELTEEASVVSKDFWDKNRQAELNVRELKTYSHMDSIGKRYKFDFAMKASRNIYHGFFTIDPIEFKVNQFLRYSGHEGVRLGLGAYTSPKFSDKWRFGGYYGYGFRDETGKYGGTLEYLFNRKKDHKLTFTYKNDVMQPGKINLQYFYNTGYWTPVFIEHMDFIEEYALTYKTRLSNFMVLQVKLRDRLIKANNDYTFYNDTEPDAIEQDRFKFTELNLNWRWAHKEKITSNFGQQISMGSDYPVLIADFTHGFQDILDSDFEYNKVEFGVWFERYLRNFGKMDVRLEAGYVDRAIPIQLLFSNRSSYSSGVTFVSSSSFQTMHFNEFLSDRYATFYFNHNFGPLLFRLPRFSPEFSLYHAMSYGTMTNDTYHHQQEYKTLENGFFESGIVIDNIFHISLLKAGYIGFGAGVFHRYGPNSRPNSHENWALKYSVIYTIN